MLGMKMQQNQVIMEIMKELLKTHMSDMASLRKGQWDLWYKAREKAGAAMGEKEKAYYENLASEIEEKDFTRWGAFKGTLQGFGGKNTTAEGAGGADLATKFGLGGGEDFLKPPTELSTSEKPPMMNRIKNAATPVMRGMGQAAVAPFNAMTAGVPAGVDAMLKGLRGPRGAGAPARAGKDQYGHTIGEIYKGYKYIGNNQWQK
jgi:hypothetical protein